MSMQVIAYGISIEIPRHDELVNIYDVEAFLYHFEAFVRYYLSSFTLTTLTDHNRSALQILHETSTYHKTICSLYSQSGTRFTRLCRKTMPRNEE
jgi:hypothetical protein